MEEKMPLLPTKAEEPGNRETTITATATSSSSTAPGGEVIKSVRITSWGVVKEEGKRVGLIAAPMIAVVLLQALLQAISIMMVGHLDELALSSSALAISFANVTGFSVILGLASGLETLCGQTYGAKQYTKVGLHTYTAILTLTIVTIPLSFIWAYMGNILVFLGQDSTISLEAGKFATCLIPSLIGYAALQALTRYFLSQSLIMPMLVGSCLATCIDVPLCWVLVFKTRLVNLGAAVAMNIAVWVNVIFLSVYMRVSSDCGRTRPPVLSIEVVQGIGEFLRFAVPSAVMICFEWWSFEIVILLSGLLENPELETSVLSICLTTTSTLYSIPYSLGAAGSTRVANELGAGNPEAARMAFYTVMLIATSEGVTVSSILYGLRHVFGYLFSSEAAVVEYVDHIAPLLCISVMIDSLTGILSGIARGCGWQHVGAVANLGAYYLVGIPVGVGLGIGMKMEGRGLWIGVLCGSFMQFLLLFVLNVRTDWERRATEARLRIFESGCVEYEEIDEGRS